MTKAAAVALADVPLTIPRPSLPKGAVVLIPTLKVLL